MIVMKAYSRNMLIVKYVCDASHIYFNEILHFYIRQNLLFCLSGYSVSLVILSLLLFCLSGYSVLKYFV